MAFCTYCGQEFQRNEHLERHLATHANIKRFKCNICHLSFSRRDVLQRHVAVHGETSADGQSSNQPMAGVRHRTQEACRNCARTKTKCDSNTPCNRCHVKKITCDRRPRKTPARASLSGASQDSTTTSVSEINVTRDVGSSTINVDVEHARPNRNVQSASENSEGLDISTHSSAPPPTKQLRVHEAIIESVATGGFGTFMENVSEQNMSNAAVPPGTGSLVIGSHIESWTGQNQGLITTRNSEQTEHSTGAIGPSQYRVICNTGLTSHSPTEMQTDGSANLWNEERQAYDIRWQYNTDAVEHQVIIQAYNYWSSFRCNPFEDMSKCPRTAGVLLESLGHMPELDELWGWLGLDFASPNPFEPLASLPLRESVRDKLAAISQALLQKALRVHQLDPATAAASYPSPSPDGNSRGFLILPPSATMEHFLREYMRIFEPFYLLIPGGVLDANMLLNGSNDTSSTLLILLMIGQGAISDPTNEARRLSGGLTEVCRISLFDTVEKDVSVCHQPLLLHCALVFIIQAAWSGDKWLMDIGLGQRGIYIAIVRNSRLFDAQVSHTESLELSDDSRHVAWLERERLIRLTYTWAILDLELSLFLDSTPHIQIADLNLVLPSPAELYLACDTDSWKRGMNDTPPIQPSLRVLFEWFLTDQITRDRRRCLTPSAFRLLLHPLYSLVNSFRQVLSCFSEGPNSRLFSPVTKRSTDVRMEEMQVLLHRWFSLYCSRLREVEQSNVSFNQFRSPLMTATLITYHIIYLNTVTGFTDIESLARRGLSDSRLQQLSSTRVEQYIHCPDEALLHIGQILYLLRSFDKKVRPPWWPAALYRVTLTLWAISVFCGARWKLPSSTLVLIDVESRGDDDAVYRHFYSSVGASISGSNAATTSDSSPNHQVSIPAITDQRGGSEPVALDDPIRTLETCLLAFGGGIATRFSEGIHTKLKQFLASRYGLRNG
ncbi:hypothetical protein F5Y00DRAFT_253762 [Daldinia vernicosa]|uniref:uncharacterized protein n=1 Tax=Daldinia vernicosa TaxID=114800 RepID=UPI002007AEB3|nr:uncharacterized protein F5Y00DRAFT_253762 [Daldinia vernicosa]KAI0847763.1 hypothetical protein F5Y00DRAFT_253762 [Daldinia vernicosa]